jgi:hypothetical protein
MLFYLFFTSLALIVLIAFICILIQPKKTKNSINTTPEGEYLFAKEIFTRDPETFKDKDKDGIDDIIDPKV